MDRDAAIRRIKPNLRRRVMLRFADGEEIEAELAGIDEREEDFTFVVRAVKSKNASGSPYTAIGTTYIAPFGDLLDIQPVSAQS